MIKILHVAIKTQCIRRNKDLKLNKSSHRHREQTYGHEQGQEEEGEDEKNGERNIYTTMCKIDSQWKFAV